jgi:hypothetical protein
MRKPLSQTDKAKLELKPLKVGDSLTRAVDLEKRQFCYDAARELGFRLCIQRLPLKVNRFQVTRIA